MFKRTSFSLIFVNSLLCKFKFLAIKDTTSIDYMSAHLGIQEPINIPGLLYNTVLYSRISEVTLIIARPEMVILG